MRELKGSESVRSAKCRQRGVAGDSRTPTLPDFPARKLITDQGKQALIFSARNLLKEEEQCWQHSFVDADSGSEHSGPAQF